MVFLGGLGHLLKSAISNSPWLFCGILFIQGLNWRTFFYSPQPAFCHILLACLTDALFARGGGEAMREAMGVMSCRLGILAFVCIRKYWICAFFQLFVRCAPSKFFNSCSFVSLSQSYMPHNTYTYVFLFFVSSHVCLIFPTQKTWLNFFFLLLVILCCAHFIFSL